MSLIGSFLAFVGVAAAVKPPREKEDLRRAYDDLRREVEYLRRQRDLWPNFANQIQPPQQQAYQIMQNPHAGLGAPYQSAMLMPCTCVPGRAQMFAQANQQARQQALAAQRMAQNIACLNDQ